MDNSKRTKVKLLFISLVFGLLGLAGFLFYQSLQFHLVNTTPNMNSVGVVTPYISFNYNETLRSDIKVTSSPNIVESYKVSGKNIIVSLDSSVISLGKNYTVVIGKVSGPNGKSLPSRSFNFKVRNIAFDSMPLAQQQAVMKRQLAVIYSRTSISYVGFDSLINSGLSADQVELLKQAFFLFSQFVNKDISRVIIVTGSVEQAPYDSTSATQVSSVSFNLNIDSKTMAAKLEYGGLSDVQLTLYDQAGGSLVYDSGLLTPANL